MTSHDDRATLDAELAEAEADVTRIREQNKALSDGFREDPTEDNRELLRRGAASLSAARDRVDKAKAAIELFETTGSIHGLLAKDGQVVGTVAVAIPPGTSREARERAIDDVLSNDLHRAADSLGAVLAASPASYTRERPGRDGEGRTVLEVCGRVEGDRLVPAVSRGAGKR